MNFKKNTAFTLLELLVAATISLILAGVMLTIVAHTLALWQRTQNSSAASAQAMLALDLIERDLQASVFRTDGGTWLSVNVINGSLSLVPHGWLTAAAMKPATGVSQRLVPDLGDGLAPLITNARFGLSGTWLRLVTTNVEAEGSLPVAVSYQMTRRPVSGSIAASNVAEVRYSLFRSAVSTSATFTTGNDVTASGYGSSSVTPAAARNARTLTNPNTSDVLATNVVDFGVWLYVREAGTDNLRRIFPADNEDLAHAALGVPASPDGDRFPDVADVMIRILSDRGAVLLEELEIGGGHVARPSTYATDAEWWWGIVETNSHVYVRRAAVKGAAW